MKTRLSILAVALALASCTPHEVQEFCGEPVFATTEDSASKVYVDNGLHTLWNTGDRISVFDFSTANSAFVLKGEGGSSSGSFTAAAARGSGTQLSALYAVYPYDSSISISTSGALSVNYPASQSYAANTFGNGDCVMVCASSGRQLHFRNAGGCLVVKLYGEGMSVESVTLQGNGGERIAGQASISVPEDGTPSVSMASGASSLITLSCSTPVSLGATETQSTAFWFFLPPTVFGRGITITVNTTDGTVFTKSTGQKIDVPRSKVVPMAPLEVDAGSVTVSYTESTENFPNPERGYYKHYEAYGADGSVISASAINSGFLEGRTLFFYNFYLYDFINSDISSEYLTLVENNLKALRKGGAKLVLRFCYKSSSDDTPYDPEEPQLMRHIAQVRPLLQEYSDVIYVLQAGFIGLWGEWYYTTNYIYKPSSSLDYQPRKRVIEALLEAMPADRQIDLRTPTFKMKMYGYSLSDTLTRAEAHTETPKARLGAHNDCFLKSSSDSGTFGSEAERSYWKAETRYLIMGGETCGLSDYCHCGAYAGNPGALSELASYHYSYLNMSYHSGVTGQWKTEGCYDEIGKRLGYRLVLQEGTFPKRPRAGRSCKVTLKLRNVGFAAPMNPRTAYLLLVNSSGTELGRWPLESDIRFWLPESGLVTVDQTITLPAGLSGACRLCLWMPDPSPNLSAKPSCAIRLANDGVWDSSKGYNVLTTFNF